MNPSATISLGPNCRFRYSFCSAEVRTSVWLGTRRYRVLECRARRGCRNFGKLPPLQAFSMVVRMPLLRSPVCISSVSLPFFSSSSVAKGQKLNGNIRFGRHGLVVAASASGRDVESEDEVGQDTEDVEVREVIDVSNSAEARDREVEEEIKYRENYRKFRESLQVNRKRFWHNLKEQHQIYKTDREEWGVGLNPIFTVYEDAEGKRYKVDVDEDEIWMRCGVDPQFPQFAEDEAREVVERRIAKANAVARNIVDGVYEPNELSVLYKFQREGQGTTVGSVRWDGDSELVPRKFLPTPLRNINFGAVLAVAVVGFFAFKWWSGRKTKSTNPVVDEQELRLMKIRKLKAKMNEKQVFENPEVIEEDATKKNGGFSRDREPPEREAKNAVVDVTPNKGVDIKPSIADKEFQKKVEEIRAMARRARLQEERSADAQSTKNLQMSQRMRSEGQTKKSIRSKELDSLAENLDDVRRLGHTDENGKPPTVQEVSTSIRDDKTSSVVDKPTPQESTLPTNGRAIPPAKSSAGVKPRIILSPKEARASIAAKRSRLESGDSSAVSRKSEFSMDDLKAKLKSKRSKPAAESVNGTSKDVENGALRDAQSQSSEGLSGVFSEEPLSSFVGGSSSGTANGQVSRSNTEAVSSVPLGEDVGISTGEVSLKTSMQGGTEQPLDQAKKEEGIGEKAGEKRPKPSKEEEEEQEWMRDEVLRDIVFKVQANEEAGREPFFGLNSEQEKRFFKGLERKFDREGERVKSWIKDRVENIDYGLDGISLLDPPEAYTMKWKEGMEPSRKALDFSERFRKDRMRLMQEQSGMDYTSPQPPDDEDDVQTSQPRTPPSTATSSVAPKSPPTNVGQGKAKEIISNSQTKTVVTSSGRPDAFNPGVASKGVSEEESAESWQNTKRWAKDLQRQYELERDPETRALMREIGQDLDRWITEEEVEEASRLLEKGVEGEQEYVRMHYEKTKAKIKQQREIFGREAMMNKYAEYKPEQEEPELWWFDLPYVLCLGLQSSVHGEVQSGLYSVDIGPAVEGVGDTSDMVHTVAFQDRGDAHNFSKLLRQESEKLGTDAVEVIPFEPKELYRDAKAEGYKVTVIKKGQLQLSIDQPLEEVEARILEIGSARYYDDLLRDRSIDMDAVIDEGLGYGRNLQF